MTNLRIALCFCLAAAAASSHSFALEADLSAAGTASTETNNHLYPDLDATLSHQGTNFGFLWDVSMDGSGTYGNILGGFFGFKTVRIKQGGLTWNDNENLSAAVGVLALHDEVDSPYSLALSSLGNSALTTSYRYEDDRFFFSDRWFALNYDSSGTFLKGDGTTIDPITNGPETISWPDRSAVIKSYGIKAGDFRFGFQDIIVYTNLDYGTAAQRGPLFDLEYFINPAPAFLIQYADTAVDAPWKKSGSINDNSLMGLFGTWKSGAFTADAQVLVDDFDVNAILSPKSYQNPNKISWTLGGSMETEYGTFRFDHAGATKYNFESSGAGGEDNLAYGYTYYPDTEYLLNGSYFAIDPESNYVGYLHGENNIAFMASWAKKFGQLSASSSLEFTLSGSKSPANPWGPLTSFPSGTHMLDDPSLEKKLVLAGSAAYVWHDFRLFASAKIGYVWNKLELTAVVGEVAHSINNGISYYSPSSGNAFIGAITLGGSWSLKF
jgi:hypothetical protein